MLALVILQIGPSVFFAFNLFLILLELFANKLGFRSSQEIQDFRASVLV